MHHECMVAAWEIAQYVLPWSQQLLAGTQVTCTMQGMPEGHTEACYPVRKPGISHHKQQTLSPADVDRRDVRPGLVHADKITQA